MPASEPELGKFDVTARLLKLVSEMPQDQQLTLLKQLVADRVSSHLYKLIVEMTEDQQISLLEQIAQRQESQLGTMATGLADTAVPMREYYRKPCLINVSYSVQNRNLKSYILDIGVEGVFIETNLRVPVGEELLLKFSLPGQPQPLKFTGKIAWSSTKGFGVKFNNINAHQSNIIKSFVEQKE